MSWDTVSIDGSKVHLQPQVYSLDGSQALSQAVHEHHPWTLPYLLLEQ